MGGVKEPNRPRREIERREGETNTRPERGGKEREEGGGGGSEGEAGGTPTRLRTEGKREAWG